MKARTVLPADMITREGESVVLVGHRVVRLSQLATILLEELAGQSWVEDTRLAATLEDRLGPPPSGVDPVHAVRAALEVLAEEGLVTWQRHQD